jgi:Zn-dependent M28 family amino/carboxypeptidase
MDIPWSRMSLAASQPGMWLADPSLQDAKSPKLTVTFNPARAEYLFLGSGHTFAELLALADAGKPLPRFALPPTIDAKVSAERSQVEAPNLVGVYRGTDPKLKDEYVVYSAHLDHLGVGEPIHGDNIYNGAMDDGSGIASILEIAMALHDSHAKLKRSVIFLAVTAEEKGLLGSRYFGGHPTVAKKDIVANLNIDMFLPLHPLKILTVEGVDESTLGDEIRSVGKQDGIDVEADQEPDRNLFIRSDQYNFIRSGVPALAFKFGYVKGSPEELLHKQWLTNRYHAPSDDVNQPVDKAAAARFDEIMLQLGEKVANDDARPHWNDNSFFKRFAK